MLSESIKQADQTLSALAADIRILRYVTPINRADQKEKFLKYSIQNPEFLYKDPDYSTEQYSEKLASIELSDDDEALFKIIEGFRRRLFIENGIIANLGDSDHVREASLTLFGRPNVELLSSAHQILQREIEPDSSLPIASADDLQVTMRAKFDELNLPTPWKVAISDKIASVTTFTNGEIHIPSNGKYTSLRLQGLVNHEIGVHALRAENGRQQKLKIFSHGLLGYIATEEGMAISAQIVTDTMSDYDLMRYAARVVASNAVYEDLSFREAYDQLMAYNYFSPDQAYEIVERTYRAGGYTKDMIYLQGVQKIVESLQHGVDVEDLYLGKFSVDQLEDIKALVDKGILHPAKFLPWFIEIFRSQQGISKIVNALFP